MMKAKLLEIVKSKLGITSTVRDSLLNFLIDTTLKEMNDEHKMVLTDENLTLQEFIIDYVVFKYKNVDFKGIPRFLQFRLHNLKINRMRNNK